VRERERERERKGEVGSGREREGRGRESSLKTRELRNFKTKLPSSFPGAPGRAVVRLAREPFDRASLAAAGSVVAEEEENEESRASKKAKSETSSSGLLGASLRLSKTFRNDIYGTFRGSFAPSESLLEASGAGVVVDVTYPATEKHVAKQRAQQRVMLIETKELYEKITLPLVEAMPASRVAWVDNILEGRAEAERVMARGGGEGEDDQWVLLPDMKWDHRTAAAALAELKKLEQENDEKGEGKVAPETLAAASDRAKSARDSLYAQLVFRDEKLKSLRDIDGETAPRVEAAVSAALDFIKDEYGIPRSSLRAFFHYHPSYWRLHVHIVGPQAFPDDDAGRAHLVGDVFEAVRAQPQWWRERALSVRSFRGDELAEVLLAASAAAGE